MEKFTDPEYLRSEQYKNNQNLTIRINLHAKYSTNTYGFHKWDFDHYEFPSNCKILEVGTGSGDLWFENKHRIPQINRLVISDYSSGMLEGTKVRLQSILPINTEYKTIDAQNLPFADESFDIVIANHMLYHVPEVPKAISEIHRILVKGGTLYANTNGKNHMIDLYNLMEKFDPKNECNRIKSLSFSLENGLELVKSFSSSKLLRYNDSLHVTDANDLLLYQLSLISNNRELQTESSQKKLLVFFQEIIDKKGYIKITKDAGMIIAKK